MLKKIDLARKVFKRWLNGYGAFTPLFLMPEVMDIYIRRLDDDRSSHTQFHHHNQP